MAPRTWLITGCSSGFGRRLAEVALERGDQVVATARRPDALDDLVALAPDRVLAAALDVTSPAAIAAAVGATRDRFGAIDVLVNNAGFGSVGAIEEIEPGHLREVMETMFFGPVALTQAVLPGMRARGSGAIVQMSSMGGQLSPPGFGAYCAAKFALEAASESLAAEVARPRSTRTSRRSGSRWAVTRWRRSARRSSSAWPSSPAGRRRAAPPPSPADALRAQPASICASIISAPRARATDTRWWPSRIA
jgi:NAD(P)-dependent dehydrogenase (short-subunit alcohol dehydrogenase family)